LKLAGPGSDQLVVLQKRIELGVEIEDEVVSKVGQDQRCIAR